MDRRDLLRDLRAHGARWPAEAETVRRFVEFLAAHPDAFARSLACGHVTGSAWLVDRAGARVLLTHHKKLGIWVQLGGHADGDADAFRVARREAEEESGLADIEAVAPEIFDVDVHEIPARGAEPAHLHWDVRYAFRATKSEAFRLSDESHAPSWIEIAALETVTREESMLRMARKWRAGFPRARGASE